MVVVPLERRKLAIVAGLEEGYQGASPYYFVPVVDIVDFPEFDAEMAAVPLHLLNYAIAAGVEGEEGRRED